MEKKKLKKRIKEKKRTTFWVVVLNLPHGIAKTAPKGLEGAEVTHIHITQNNMILLHIKDASYARTKQKKEKDYDDNDDTNDQ